MAGGNKSRSYLIPAIPALVLAQFFAVAAITLMLVWLLHFRRGVSLKANDSEKLLNASSSSSYAAWADYMHRRSDHGIQAGSRSKEGEEGGPHAAEPVRSSSGWSRSVRHLQAIYGPPRAKRPQLALLDRSGRHDSVLCPVPGGIRVLLVSGSEVVCEGGSETLARVFRPGDLCFGGFQLWDRFDSEVPVLVAPEG
ncbi:hypothetical protein HPP92_002031 [Vanilla planifolia]|uniref:Uncharacterized protein n=1 Tax=Vanilla planifolia TaxID=51239 RepID=A0A835S5N0_VANPL|nr:hypothetical protein HPP92_002290 [Vanilla planifolia]KAG0501959.1 hypothetical protein HPP92_002031 [Vanilla planifolia]